MGSRNALRNSLGPWVARAKVCRLSPSVGVQGSSICCLSSLMASHGMLSFMDATSSTPQKKVENATSFMDATSSVFMDATSSTHLYVATAVATPEKKPNDIWNMPDWCNPVHPKYDRYTAEWEQMRKKKAQADKMKNGGMKKWWQIQPKPMIGVWLQKPSKRTNSSPVVIID